MKKEVRREIVIIVLLVIGVLTGACGVGYMMALGDKKLIQQGYQQGLDHCAAAHRTVEEPNEETPGG